MTWAVYREINKPIDAVRSVCNAAKDALDKGNLFTAAYYLREMADEGDIDRLFELALDNAKGRGDIWWQYRALQELGMQTEADNLLRQHKDEIEKSGELHLLEALALAENDEKRYIELRKQEALEESKS